MKQEIADYLNAEADKTKAAQRAEPKTVKRLVRWTATYETLIEVPEGEDEQDIASNIPIAVPGSAYQSDTWDVDGIYEATPEQIAEHEASKD